MHCIGVNETLYLFMKTLLLLCLIAPIYLFAQTENDGIMMSKNNFCGGINLEQNTWDTYWQGTLKRDNLNFGDITTTKTSINGNYGISNKLNIMFSMPYITTKANAGTMQGQNGLQDLSLNLKYLAFNKKHDNYRFAIFTGLGYSFPVSNYLADYMPLSIGNRSKNLSFRLISDFTVKKFFTTISAAYVQRSIIKIDRDSYFTDKMHYSNEVAMPNVFLLDYKIGYRGKRLIAEANFNRHFTLDGFDITPNNMPFPSNKVVINQIGFYTKYNLNYIKNLSLTAAFNYVVNGRNVGQSKNYGLGVLYAFNIKRK